MPTLFRLALLFCLIAPGAGAAPACRDIVEAAQSYSLCEFDATKSAIRLFLKDGQGEVYGAFAPLAADLDRRGERLAFAMNGGMYDDNRLPVGLFVEGGASLRAANLKNGAGNFHMKPNGVFFIEAQGAGVMETKRFLASGKRALYATQSGPMLVAGGRINPHIHDSGVSEKIRNGVCVTQKRLVHFVISNEPVTFHAFAHLFKDRLQCQDALFLDGSVSSLYAPELSRHDRFRPMGPIIGVVEKK
jgi:uncharacterized protein YigE (DUF2233 family)